MGSEALVDSPSAARMQHFEARHPVRRMANEVVEQLPLARAYLADQLQRAATSIPLNIAEGAGEYSASDKARFYRIARRSATECAATSMFAGRWL